MSHDNLTFPPRPTDLDTTVPHHPEEYRAFKRRVQDWNDQCTAIRQAARVAQEQASQPKVMTDDDIYAARLAEHQRVTEARLEREAQEMRQQLEHQQYLSETPPVVTVSTNNLYAFSVEVAHRGSQGYEIIDNTLMQVGASFYSVEMKLKNPKKGGR